MSANIATLIKLFYNIAIDKESKVIVASSFFIVSRQKDTQHDVRPVIFNIISLIHHHRTAQSFDIRYLPSKYCSSRKLISSQPTPCHDGRAGSTTLDCRKYNRWFALNSCFPSSRILDRPTRSPRQQTPEIAHFHKVGELFSDHYQLGAHIRNLSCLLTNTKVPVTTNTTSLPVTSRRFAHIGTFHALANFAIGMAATRSGHKWLVTYLLIHKRRRKWTTKLTYIRRNIFKQHRNGTLFNATTFCHNTKRAHFIIQRNTVLWTGSRRFCRKQRQTRNCRHDTRYCVPARMHPNGRKAIRLPIRRLGMSSPETF